MSIAGLDVGTTVCRLIAVDDEGNVRATAYSEYPLITKGSRLEIDPMSTATKIAWVIDNAKSKQELPSRYMCAEDFVLAKFTGNPVMSWSSAARTMMYDVTKKEWWKELMDYLEIREEMVSHTLPSAEVVGRMSAGVREELGFSSNVLIATGGHDQICGAIGSGAVMDGIVADNTGTFECVLACVGDERRRTADRSLLMNNGLALYPHGPALRTLAHTARRTGV